MTTPNSRQGVHTPPSQLAGTGGGAGNERNQDGCNQDCKTFFDYEREATAATAAGFEEWAKTNTSALAYLESRARYYAGMGFPFSFSLPWEECRYWHGAANKHHPCKLPNEYRCLVAAWVCDRNPAVDALVRRRKR